MLKNKFLFLIPVVILFSAFVLHIEGHTLISQTGKIYFWWGQQGIEDSQQVMDWYSYSHFIHGIIFFFLIGFVLNKFYRPQPLLTKEGSTNAKDFVLLLAVITESIWEMLENSPIIINRYREGALAAGYFGDSILNSTSDICFMILGFLFARKMGWKMCLALVIFLELFTLYFIRDNLTLNIVMLIHPFAGLSNWQAGL